MTHKQRLENVSHIKEKIMVTRNNKPKGPEALPFVAWMKQNEDGVGKPLDGFEQSGT